MHTPDSPERGELRASLREISKALIPLHRHLIDAAKSDYVFAFDSDVSPTRLVDLLQTDSFFAWLKPLTSLIVDIDEMVRTDFDDAAARAIPRRIEQIFAGDQYVAMLQRDVEVAGAHAAVRKALQGLTSGNGR